MTFSYSDCFIFFSNNVTDIKIKKIIFEVEYSKNLLLNRVIYDIKKIIKLIP